MRLSGLSGRPVFGTVLAAILVSVSFSVSALGAQTGKSASERPFYLGEAGIEQQIGERIPLDLELVDETGETVRLGEYFGDEPVILAPVYYECPMLCTLILEGLVKSLKALTFGAREDYELVVFSFDPSETPTQAMERKQRALDLFDREGAGEGWHFLVGDETSVERLTDAIGFRSEFDEERGEFIHAATILILQPDGTISRYFYGVDYPPKNLRLGLVEASQGEIGNPIDQVLLYCYRYNPETGKYSLLTMRLVRIGAAVTIVGIGLLILTLVRLEKGRTRLSEGSA
ncbi:MAG: SCO family protein [Thermoanaerobaculia bacterium]|nr:SCO family protein [Thermoanaerobaculia bacterium]